MMKLFKNLAKSAGNIGWSLIPIVIFGFVMGAVIMLAWNYVITYIWATLPKLGYLHGIALYALLVILGSTSGNIRSDLEKKPCPTCGDKK